jgi:integrase
MNQKTTLSREYTTEEDWLAEIFEVSNSYGSLSLAETSLKALDIFCKAKLELPDPDVSDLENVKQEKLKTCHTPKQRYDVNREYDLAVKARFAVVYAQGRAEIISRFQQWFEQSPPDIQSICTNLQQFVKFCSIAHPEIKHLKNMMWRAKSSQSIQTYFSSIKEYLRKCHGIRLTSDDVKDFIRFPKDKKQLREPIELPILKKILADASPLRRALYYVLLTSGMRLGEALSLKKTSFNTDVRPIQVHLRAQDTKTGEARDTYISEEAYERLAPILEKTNDGEYIFHDYSNTYLAVTNEDRYFHRLRVRIAKRYGDKEPCDEFPEGTGILKRYEDSIRFCVQIHAFRAWFMTKASMKHGSDYSHGLAGHHTYLDQYIRIPNKQKAKMYLSLEKELLLETSRVHSEQFHEVEIAEMQEEIRKLKAMAVRKEELQYHKEVYNGEGIPIRVTSIAGVLS